MTFPNEKSSFSAAASSAAPDRRRSPRSLFGAEVKILWAGPEFTGIVRDVSDCGMAFSVERAGAGGRLTVGTRLRLLFSPPECSDCASVNVIADVVRLGADAPDRILVAVAFQRL